MLFDHWSVLPNPFSCLSVGVRLFVGVIVGCSYLVIMAWAILVPLGISMVCCVRLMATIIHSPR